MGNLRSRLFIILALACAIGLASAHKLKKGDKNKKANYFTIFKGTNFEGDHKSLDIPTNCKPIPEDFNNKIKSVKLYGDCVYLYNDDYCKGENAWPLTLNETLPSVNDTPIDRISSYIGCKI